MESTKLIKRIFETYSSSYSFYLRDLRNNRVYELGENRSYPICSCFKLAVLMAYFSSIQSENQLNEENQIFPIHFSPGGGVINYFNSPVKFTNLQLVQMMLGFSDGTATDFLINKVGIENVNLLLESLPGKSYIAGNLSEMVNAFNAIENSRLIKGSLAENEVGNIVTKLSKMGTVTAQGLAELALRSFNHRITPELSNSYRDCINVMRSQPRTSMFLQDDLKFFGKTGSFGYGFFTNDCGVLFDKDSNEQIAVFSFCSYGWKIEKEVIESVCGLIGLEILKTINIEAKINQRWSKDCEKQLIGNVL